MRRFYVPLLLVLAIPAALFAAPPEVPRELKCEPGQLLRIVAKGEKVGTGKNFTDEQAFFDQLVSKPGEHRFIFQATKPGVYVVGFVTVGEGEIVFCTITVGAAPLPPAPDPKPKPPTPPDPKPIDPLLKALTDAYALETGVDKRERVRALAGVMRQGAAWADSADYTTTAALAAAVSKKRAADVADSVPLVRGAVGFYLNGLFGTASAPLTADNRPKIKAAYEKLAATLEEVAK